MGISARSSPIADVAQAPGVILAIDYGQKRFGLALSDEFGVTSRPIATWIRINRRRDLARLRQFTRERAVRRIVIGLPLHLDGTPSEMSEEAKRFASRIEKFLGLPVAMMDERLSSWEAHRIRPVTTSRLRGRGGSSKSSSAKKEPPLDQIAAAILLRDYLDRERARAGSRV